MCSRTPGPPRWPPGGSMSVCLVGGRPLWSLATHSRHHGHLPYGLQPGWAPRTQAPRFRLRRRSSLTPATLPTFPLLHLVRHQGGTCVPPRRAGTEVCEENGGLRRLAGTSRREGLRQPHRGGASRWRATAPRLRPGKPRSLPPAPTCHRPCTAVCRFAQSRPNPNPDPNDRHRVVLRIDGGRARRVSRRLGGSHRLPRPHPQPAAVAHSGL